MNPYAIFCLGIVIGFALGIWAVETITLYFLSKRTKEKDTAKFMMDGRC